MQADPSFLLGAHVIKQTLLCSGLLVNTTEFTGVFTAIYFNWYYILKNIAFIYPTEFTQEN